jgi:hypothetical protein
MIEHRPKKWSAVKLASAFNWSDSDGSLVESHHPSARHQAEASALLFRRKNLTKVIDCFFKALARSSDMPSSQAPTHGVKAAPDTAVAAYLASASRSSLQQDKQRLARLVREHLGPDILHQVQEQPRWRDNVQASPGPTSAPAIPAASTMSHGRINFSPAPPPKPSNASRSRASGTYTKCVVKARTSKSGSMANGPLTTSKATQPFRRPASSRCRFTAGAKPKYSSGTSGCRNYRES